MWPRFRPATTAGVSMRAPRPVLIEHDAGLHAVDRVRIHQVPGRRRQRRVERDDVGLSPQRFEGNVRHPQRPALVARRHVEGQHAAAKRPHHARDQSPIFPVPTMPTVCPCRSKPSSPSREKLPSRTRANARQTLRFEGEDEGDGVLGHGMGRIRRHARHHQAQTLGGLNVHMVEAGGTEGDQAGAAGRERGQDIRAQTIVHERAHGRRSRGQRRRGDRQARLEVLDVMRARLIGRIEEFPVERVRAEEGQVHGCRRRGPMERLARESAIRASSRRSRVSSFRAFITQKDAIRWYPAGLDVKYVQAALSAAKRFRSAGVEHGLAILESSTGPSGRPRPRRPPGRRAP